MTRRFRMKREDWRRENMWVGKGVPAWLALVGICGLALAAALWRAGSSPFG